MPVYKVNVKWGKEKFEGLELNTDESPELFKAQLFAMSSVAPERQKVMLKGAVLKDDSWGNWGNKIKEGITLMMMGSAEALPQAPTQKPVFMEDMSDSQLASAYELPAGLNNLGNTCYMNATVQCLRNVPELRKSLTKYTGSIEFGGQSGSPQSVTAALRDLYKSMDKTSEAMPPIIFLQVLHKAFPQFSEKTEQGIFVQQDANECWTQLVRILQQKLPGEAQSESEEQKAAAASSKGFMDQYFGIESESVMKCVEASDEPETKSKETLFQLSCFISQEVKYIHTGLQSSKLTRLPAYLTVQLVRFYFKEKEAVNAKILKDIKFPLSLDVYDLCSEELKVKLNPKREQFKEMEDRKVEEAQKLKDSAKNGVKPEEKEQPMEVDDKKKVTNIEPYSFPDDIGSNNSGYYELTAVLTHQGRSSSSGHYVAWIRKKDDEWYKCDDDKISMIYSEDVLKLSGGGDWHCAYVLLYAPRRLETLVDATD